MDSVKLAVNGTPHAGASRWKKELLDAGAFFLREAATAPCYRLWSINDNNPAMLRVDPADPRPSASPWRYGRFRRPARLRPYEGARRSRSARSPSLMVRSFSASSVSRSSSAAKGDLLLRRLAQLYRPHSDPSGAAAPLSSRRHPPFLLWNDNAPRFAAAPRPAAPAAPHLALYAKKSEMPQRPRFFICPCSVVLFSSGSRLVMLCRLMPSVEALCSSAEVVGRDQSRHPPG